MRPAPIDHENLAAEHPAVVGGEKQHHPRNIRRAEEALHRLLLPNELELLGTYPLAELLFCHDPARDHCIDADPVWAELFGKRS